MTVERVAQPAHEPGAPNFPGAHAKPGVPRVLSIAGTDPTGGAGIQADLKAIAAAGGYGMSAVTALVAQNTRGVREVHVPPLDFLRAQLHAVRDDVSIDAIKIGMLGSAEITRVVGEFLRELHGVPVVLDPVIVATSGDRLLEESAEEAVRQLCTQVDLITPNLKELAVLTRTAEARNLDEAIATAVKWAATHGTSVVVKGGHLRSGRADNALVAPDGSVHRVPCPRVDTPHTHGTGCSLSAALATRLGGGDSQIDALTWSTGWLLESITHAADLQVGQGNGPVDHFHRQRRLSAAGAVRMVVDDYRADQPAAPRIPAAGPHTTDLWEAASLAWEEITGLDFVGKLGAGTLNTADFGFYLDQDAQYLSRYSKALARLAALATNHDEQLHWAQGAAEVIDVEAALHRDWLDGDVSGTPSSVTAAYTDMLIAATHSDDYAVGVAAVLPCYWLYAEVGLHLADSDSPEHPFRDWLAMYGGEDFRASVERALVIAERVLADASPAVRSRAQRAFIEASRHEVAFFDQAHRRI